MIASATKLMGLIVDALEEVQFFTEEEIEPAPHFGKGVTTSYIQNMAKIKGQVKSLLNIDKIIEEDKVALRAYAFPDEKIPQPA